MKLSMRTQILPQATETTKKTEIRKFKMADGRGIKTTFGLYLSCMLSRYDEIWSEEAESHAHEAG